jgi:2-methylisocitrate lyase-like PEP mutase family enzyme
MASTVSEKRAAFRDLHRTGCFVMPNPWDVGTAIALEGLGFPALATTSAGMAWSLGRADNRVTLEAVLEHLTAVAAAVDVPVNADFENAFAVDPSAVGEHVAVAARTGIAGLSVEDSSGDPQTPLFGFDLAVRRIAAARAAIDGNDSGVLLTARSEGLISGPADLDETIRRLVAYSEVGADCLYAPGLRNEADISAAVTAVAPKPVNVLTPRLPVATLAALGVRRISVGGALARVAWGEFLRSAREIADQGTFEAFTRGARGGELNAIFADRD